jgi:hypothetical protein
MLENLGDAGFAFGQAFALRGYGHGCRFKQVIVWLYGLLLSGQFVTPTGLGFFPKTL